MADGRKGEARRADRRILHRQPHGLMQCHAIGLHLMQKGDKLIQPVPHLAQLPGLPCPGVGDQRIARVPGALELF